MSAAETDVLGVLGGVDVMDVDSSAGHELGESVERWLLLERLPTRADVYATADAHASPFADD